MNIKNIVFDVGNVLVTWDPETIIKRAFPSHNDPVTLKDRIFGSKPWRDLNLGKITENEAILQYHSELGIELNPLHRLMDTIKESFTVIDGSIALLERLYNTRFPLYALTNNTHELMLYLKDNYRFWSWFSDIVVSAEVGSTKPSAEIYNYLLKKHSLVPKETLFIDDHLPNLVAARELNFAVIHFRNAKQLENDIRFLFSRTGG